MIILFLISVTNPSVCEYYVRFYDDSCTVMEVPMPYTTVAVTQERPITAQRMCVVQHQTVIYILGRVI